jgi:predicted CopG family antitoxin
MKHEGAIQLDEEDFSELIEVYYEIDDENGLRICKAIGNITDSDYTEIISGYQRYYQAVEDLIADGEAEAYQSFLERDRY